MTLNRRIQFALCGTLVASVAVLSCWLGYELNWKRDRQQARTWLAAQEGSWYAPSLAGARVQASPPWVLQLFGEQGVVAIGLDVEQFKGPVPYSPDVMKRLFPEARVDF